MARARNPANRSAILQAAVDEIALVGLGAPTSKIARRAGIASGTLFLYFPTKEDLLNELYLELKGEVYARIEAGFPHKSALKLRARHVWAGFLDWSIEFPARRKVSLQLNLSDLITPITRSKAAVGRATIDRTLAALAALGAARGAARALPQGFAGAMMSAMQETTMDFIAKQPKRRRELMDLGFEAFWRAAR